MAQSFDQVSGEGRFAGVTSYKIRSDKSRAAVAAAPRVAKLQPKKGQPAPVDWSKVPPVVKARMQKHMEGMGGYEVRTRSDILQPPAGVVSPKHLDNRPSYSTIIKSTFLGAVATQWAATCISGSPSGAPRGTS